MNVIRRGLWDTSVPVAVNVAEWVPPLIGLLAFLLWGWGALTVCFSVSVAQRVAIALRLDATRSHPSNPEWDPETVDLRQQRARDFLR